MRPIHSGDVQAIPPTVARRAAKHLPVLDGVRGIAVLLVICFHVWASKIPPDSYSLAGRISVWGQTGVDLFFVLSGFLITGILLDSVGSAHFLRNFYVRRVLRIFPLYYGTLFVIYIAGPLLHLTAWTPWSKSLWFWAYLQTIPATFAPATIGGPLHFWSLAVEEHYYLVWPLLVMRLTRKRLFLAIGAAIAISILTRVILIHYESRFFTLARLDGLAIGSAVALLASSGGMARLVRPAKWVFWIAGPALFLPHLFHSSQVASVLEVFKSTRFALIYASLIVLAIENRLGRSIGMLLSGRVLGSVGKYSYGMYVFHPFILTWLVQLGLPYNGFGLIITVLATYVAAWMSWTFFEKWFLRLKRHFEYSPGSGIAGTTDLGDRVLSEASPAS